MKTKVDITKPVDYGCKTVISTRNLIHLIKCGYCPEGKI
jgi:hypothetical protein